MKKEDIQIGATLMFTSDNGRCTGKLLLDVPLKITALDNKFQCEGDCNATLDNGCEVRLSSVDGFQNGQYEKCFSVVKKAPGNYLTYL